MTLTLHVAALAGYLLAAGIVARSLALGATTVKRGAAGFAALALAAHAAGLVAFVLEYGELPLGGLGPSLSALAWVTGAFNVYVLTRREARPVGLVLAPIVALLLTFALLAGVAPDAGAATLRGAWLSTHILAALVSYACLALAFAAGVLYLLQFRELKGRRFGRIFSFFPSLDTLDKLVGRSLGIGFAALSLGLLLGWAWTLRYHRSMVPSNPQVIWGMLTWCVFAAALLARRRGAERERRGALVTVVGFLIVLAAYIALRAVGGEGQGFL